MVLQAAVTETQSAAYLIYLVVGVVSLVIGVSAALAYRNAIGKSTVRQLNELLDATNANFDRVDRERRQAQEQIAELQGQIKVLREAVTQRAAVDKLAQVEDEHHKALMHSVGRLVQVAEATAASSGIKLPRAQP